MEEYASNSYKNKEKDVSVEMPTERKVEKVVTGTVKTRKKGIGRKLFDTFITTDIKDVKSYVFKEVVIPGIRDTIYDILNSSLAALFYDTGVAPRSMRGKKGSKGTPYNSLYSGSKARVVDSDERTPIDQIIFATRMDADEVFKKMQADLKEYEMVRVADFKEYAGLTSTWNDNKIGWFNLPDRPTVRRVRDGFLLELPDPVSLD